MTWPNVPTVSTVSIPEAARDADADTRVTVGEHSTVVVRCSAEVASAMHASGHVSVAPLAAGQYEVRAKHKVGVVRYGEVELRIVPKLSVSRLLYLVGLHGDPRAWRDVEALLDERTDPLSAIAHAFVHHAERALRPTPLQGYVTHEDAECRIRGRPLFERQLSRRAGILLPIEVRFDEYEVGIVENQVVKAAALALQRLPIDRAMGARLCHLVSRLDAVEPWPSARPLPEITFGRLNERYRAALSLARVVLERRSLEFPSPRQHGTAFLVNMNHLFESYVESALRRALEARGGVVHGQRPLHLDHDGRLRMKPDVSWWHGSRCLAVVDAKYKLARNDEFPNADAYQMLAYCTRLGLRRGFLVYADLDGTEPNTTTVHNAGVEIVVTSIDLSGAIAELNASVEALAWLVSGAVVHGAQGHVQATLAHRTI